MENINLATQATQSNIVLNQIVTGKNPRNYFDKEEMELLTASVKQSGVLQPILVRPSKVTLGCFELVAGERRFRAALAAFGDGYAIPAMIRELSDAEADAAAVVENTVRADMSPAEEAVAASKEVGRASGNREEAALVLSWSLTKLNKRLALMNCSVRVRHALNERIITLGHAELLASLAKDTQDKLLPVIISEKKTVAELKGTIEQAASKLENAIFDKADCNGCQHNSSMQSAMFAESIAEGGCTNPTCYKEKTEGALNTIATSLKDEYPVIRIVRIGENLTLVKLTADGEKGVGQNQAEACRSCSDFGAAVSALPQSLGTVYKNQCFKPECNANKVADRIVADIAAEKEAAVAISKSKVISAVDAGVVKAEPKAELDEKSKPTAATSVTANERIKEYRIRVWRNAMKKEIASAPEKSRQYLVALCLTGSAKFIDGTALRGAFEKVSGSKANMLSLGENATSVEQSTEEVMNKMTTLLAASAMESIEVKQLQDLAKHHALDLKKHWKLNKEFLELMTKSEIEFLAKEIGLDKAYGDKFKKLFSEKKPDLIAKLLEIKGVDYSSVIPAVLAY